MKLAGLYYYEGSSRIGAEWPKGELAASKILRAKSIAKANEPVKRRTGKPLMTRSMPPSRKKKEATEKLDPEVEELNKFLAMDF